jgi:hypothetical protein
MNQFDVIAGLELLATVGRDEKNNKDVLVFIETSLSELEKTKMENEKSLDLSKSHLLEQRIKKLSNDIEEAKNLVADVNKQLSKKVVKAKQYEMPESITEGQKPDSIKNTIYSGKSNIHYNLENRYHIRLPIPVYLAKGGGNIKVDIQVNRQGKVIKALVGSSTNINVPMLPTYAVQAAERTLFNSDSKAPEVQQGTIIYQFVPQ